MCNMLWTPALSYHLINQPSLVARTCLRGLHFPYIWIFAVVVHGRIIKGPKDSYAVTGNTAQFYCEIDFGNRLHVMSWQFNEKDIFNYFDGYIEYPVGKAKYNVTVSSEEDKFILFVNDLTLEDGGKYTCTVITELKSADLLVYGKSII